MNVWGIAFIFCVLSFVGLSKIRKILDAVFWVLILFGFGMRPITSEKFRRLRTLALFERRLKNSEIQDGLNPQI